MANHILQINSCYFPNQAFVRQSLLLPLFLILLILPSCGTFRKDYINIATAANVQFAMDTLASLFEYETGTKANVILGSSGKLTAQIIQGAPYDVFVSANMKYPMEIYNKNLSTGKPRIYAYGSLVLWSVNDSIEPVPDILLNEKIRKIALPNPKTAPYGEAAIEFLRNMGISDHVKDKLVYGESISQVNQFLISRTADIGFTSKSVVLSPKMKSLGTWSDINTDDYSPIRQGVIVIDRKKGHMKQAEEFVIFLLSDKAKDILELYGYITDVNP